jgi:rhodanese-related sulfurtransferase
MQTLSPGDFRALMESGATIVDVRMPEELELARLPGAVAIPLPQLASRLGELDPEAPVGLLCHHGVRSELAARLLERNGFKSVAHLEGGIDAWSQAIDPSVPRY